MKKDRQENRNVPTKTFLPPLRFSELSKSWKEMRFEELYSFKSSNSLSRDKLNYETGSVKNIHYGDIHTKFNSLFDVNNETVPFINTEVSIQSINEDNYLKVGDLVIADASEDYNDIGKTIEIKNLNREKVVAGLHTFLARKESKEIVNGFVSFLMKTYNVRFQIMKIAQGTKVLGISKGRLAKIKLSIPDINEQNKLVDFLTLIDNRISTQNKIIEDYKLFKKGLMHKVFNKDNSYDNWKTIALNEVLSIPEKESPKTIDVSKILTVKLHLKGISINDRTDGLKLGATKYIIRKKGQFIYGKQNLFNGAFGIVPKEYDGFLSSGDIPTLKINTKVIIPKFLYYYFGRKSFYKNLKKIASGSGSKRIHEKTLLKLKITIPNLEEQQKIASTLSAIDDKIILETTYLEKLKSQKQFLLQNMFI